MLSSYTYATRRLLEGRINSQDRGPGFAGRYDAGSRLFDFQLACVKWLGRVPLGGTCLLAMEAGCGKTRAVGRHIHDLRERLGGGGHGPTLYLTQGGLVRQTAAELRAAGITVGAAETTKQFLQLAERDVDAAVVNVALTCWRAHRLAHEVLVVVDEAHRLRRAELAALLGCPCAERRLVLVSATPAQKHLVGIGTRLPDSCLFVVKKASLPRCNFSPIAVVPWVSPESDEARTFGADFVRDALARDELLRPLLTGLALRASEPACEEAFSKQLLGLWVALAQRVRVAAAWLRHVAFRLQHPALQAGALLDWAAEQPDLAQEVASLRHMLSQPGAACRGSRPICACCGLHEEERGRLWAKHAHLPMLLDDFLQNWTCEQRFVRGLVRLPWARDVQALRRNFAGGVEVVCVTSELSAAQRARRVEAFKRPGLQPCSAVLLRRSGFGPPGSAGERVGHVGDGALLSAIFEHLVDRRVLVTDVRCGDVGYNLQCLTHILSAVPPRNADEVRQLAGRASRLQAPRDSRCASPPPVHVIVPVRLGTGERLLVRHLQHELAEA